MYFRSVFFGIFISSHLVYAASKTCYFPGNRAIATGNVPCNESADQSHCCGADDYCLDNGLCYDHTGTVSQGGCTDPNWDSPDCFQFCKEADSGLPIVATGLFIDLKAGVRTFCCDVGTYNTTDGQCTYANRVTEPFQFDYGHVITDRSTGSTELFNSTHTQQSNSTEASGTQTVTVTATATVAGNSSSSSGDSTGKEAAIGAGIGAPLLLALMVVSYLLHREKKKLKAYEAAGGFALGEGKGQYSQQPAYPQYGYPNESAINYQHGIPSELGEPRVGELDGTTRAQELEHTK